MLNGSNPPYVVVAANGCGNLALLKREKDQSAFEELVGEHSYENKSA